MNCGFENHPVLCSRARGSRVSCSPSPVDLSVLARSISPCSQHRKDAHRACDIFLVDLLIASDRLLTFRFHRLLGSKNLVRNDWRWRHGFLWLWPGRALGAVVRPAVTTATGFAGLVPIVSIRLPVKLRDGLWSRCFAILLFTGARAFRFGGVHHAPRTFGYGRRTGFSSSNRRRNAAVSRLLRPKM